MVQNPGYAAIRQEITTALWFRDICWLERIDPRSDHVKAFASRPGEGQFQQDSVHDEFVGSHTYVHTCTQAYSRTHAHAKSKIYQLNMMVGI